MLLYMLKKIFIYVLLFSLFAIPNYGIVYLTTAWAGCACVENVVSSLFLQYGAIVFGILSILITMVINKRKTLLISFIISWIICFSALSISRIIVTRNADSVGEIFPSIVPKVNQIPQL